MTLQSAIEAELSFLRAEAEALMLDTGTASRPTGGFVYNPEQGADVEAAAELFTSPCKIQGRNLVAQDTEVGGRTSTSVRLELHLPAASAALTTGDLWEVTEVHALSTVPVGTRYRVTAPFGKTTATARRYEIEEVAS